MELKNAKVKDEDHILLDPILKIGKGFYLTVVILGSFVLLAIYAYITQFQKGLGVTGLNRPTFWGVYITNFVFFIGISHAGTLISAILRIAQAEWTAGFSHHSCGILLAFQPI